MEITTSSSMRLNALCEELDEELGVRSAARRCRETSNEQRATNNGLAGSAGVLTRPIAGKMPAVRVDRCFPAHRDKLLIIDL